MCSLKLCWIILLVYAGSKPSPADGMFSSSCHPWSLGFHPSCHCASCWPVKQKLHISVLAGPTILTVLFIEEHVCDHLAIAIWELSEWKTAHWLGYGNPVGDLLKAWWFFILSVTYCQWHTLKFCKMPNCCIVWHIGSNPGFKQCRTPSSQKISFSTKHQVN